MSVALRERGAVLLVSLYELGHQPLGLASPLGFLQAAGFAPATLDLQQERLDLSLVHAARLIAVSVPMHTALRLGVRFLERALLAHPAARVCFYGLYASLNAEYLLKRGASAVIGGEYEEALVLLCQALAALPDEAGGPLPAVPGVTTAEHQAQPVMARLPFVTPVRGGLLPLSRYARFDPGDHSPQLVAGYVEASRGCKHLCRHCPIPAVYHGRFFVVPSEVVLADVAQQVEHGARHISFGDPDFLNGPRHALAVARALHAAHPQLTFDVTVKIEHILKHRDLWPELAALGCRFVVSAVESLSPVVLALLDKGHTAQHVSAALALLRAAGIALRPSLVAFTPWTTRQDYLDLLRFVHDNRLEEHIDPVQFTIRLLVPPGSYLLQLPALQPFLGSLDESGLSYRWTHPDPGMDQLQVQAAALVEGAVKGQEEHRVTLLRLWDLALGGDGARGARPPAGWAQADLGPHTQSPVPRLTEPWFC